MAISRDDFRYDLWIFLLVLSWSLAGCTNTIRRGPDNINLLDQPAPDIRAKTIQGQTFHLKKLIGKKIILLNFFGTWCPPCRAELPSLDRLYHKFSDRMILFGIALNIESSSVRRFMRKLNLNFPVTLSSRSTDEGLPERYRIPTVPTTVLVGLDGTIKFYHPGMLRKRHFEYLEKYLSNLSPEG